eukprot:CAMPEP_0198117670 /NCGR_PEP_ID=MMETSP1442-20131203/18880_1 /TAXON_ID= /ORGANISM="Craspedostauros australis, Strain CCMP3328" /LENGTH=273 /DNA_ID=CAMNT_0043775769 /DNA_START=131 /DNA_END=952 /DNA_ORIENTATION=-
MTNTNADQIVYRNNQGCSLLEVGHFDHAIEAFTGLLSSSKQFMDNFSEQVDDCMRNPPSTSLDACMVPCSLPAGASATHNKSNTNGNGKNVDMSNSDNSGNSNNSRTINSSPTSANDSKHNFVYRHPIQLPWGMDLSYGNGVLISTAIMFNLALCHHLKAYRCMQSDASRSAQCFAKAGRLYELAYNLQLEEDLDPSHSMFFTMATINNLGMVHSANGRTQIAEQCFQHLLCAVVFLIDQNEAHVARQDSTTMDGFIANTSFLIVQHNTAGAA